MNPLFSQMPMTVFERMSSLAREHDAVNLGQGFPDFGWPDDILARAADALRHGSNQYPPMPGLPELRQAVADHYRRQQGVAVDPARVTITSGATEALAATLMGLLSPGDEVLLFEPWYDAYHPLVLYAGGVPRVARLTPPAWRLTAAMLDEAITPRTRFVVFNNPHNPTARVFGADELQLLANACVTHDLIAISDEVWEHVVFDGRAHVPLASLPGMAERTVKVGSAGKIFSLTGWKVGWAIAPEPLGEAITRAHQFLTFTTPPNLQAAVAFRLGIGDDYLPNMRTDFGSARDFLAAGLADSGFAVMPAEGTYFLCIDLEASGISLPDTEFCDRAVREAGVAAIPISPFYQGSPATNVIRLCFVKKRETLEAGLKAMRRARAIFG